MRLLVLQHIAVEHPGILRDYLRADRVSWDTVALDEGEGIPALDGYAGMLVMGGPMDVWEEDAHPWLKAEKAVIREAVRERDLPVLGICLGHQLLAEALGGRCAPMAAPEVGVAEVRLTEAGAADPLFAGSPAIERCLQWHGSAVVEAPGDAVILAESPACAVQAMRVGATAYGIQYHVEITAMTVPEWGAVPAYATALERVMGSGGLTRLAAAAAAEMAAFNRSARRLHDNFLALVRAARGPNQGEGTRSSIISG